MSGAGIHPYQQWAPAAAPPPPRPSLPPRLTLLLTTSSLSTSCNAQLYGSCNFTAVAIGPHLYILCGSLFDARSFPIDRPSPSSAVFRFDFTIAKWERLAPMLSLRGSFACARVPDSDQIIVVGGGSRHTVFSRAGSRMSSVERYDVCRDEWVAMEGLPSFQAGCVGFFAGDEEEREFWVMGGYGEARTIAEVVPVDEYYRNAVVMEMESGNGGGRWRETGDMWEEGERTKLGKIVVDEVVRRRWRRGGDDGRGRKRGCRRGPLLVVGEDAGAGHVVGAGR